MTIKQFMTLETSEDCLQALAAIFSHPGGFIIHNKTRHWIELQIGTLDTGRLTIYAAHDNWKIHLRTDAVSIEFCVHDEVDFRLIYDVIQTGNMVVTRALLDNRMLPYTS